jgi:IrrE N-terminal-like domain
MLRFIFQPIQRLWRHRRQKPLAPTPLQLLQELNYPWSQFEIQSFIEWLQKKKTRDIVLFPATTPGHVDGLWLTSDTTEFIIYSNRLTGIHRDHVILHEIAHWLLGHKTLDIDEVGDLDDFLFALPERGVAMRTFAVTRLDPDAERDAEALATLMLSRIADGNVGIISDGLQHIRDEFRFL